MSSPCLAAGCSNIARFTDGLCPTHHEQQRKGTASNSPSSDPYQECAVSHCARAANSRAEGAYCDAHYQLKWRGIDPETRKLRVNRDGRHAYSKMCWVEACPRVATTKSLCKTHYTRARQGKLEVPEDLGVIINPPCSVEGCERRIETKALCHTHYSQLREGRVPTDVRAWGKYTQEHPCMIQSCNQPAVAKDLCGSHSSRANRYNLNGVQLSLVVSVEVCDNPGCDRLAAHIDHDHATGLVRGHLCNGCNAALGFVADSAERLAGLINYLATPPATQRLAA